MKHRRSEEARWAINEGLEEYYMDEVAYMESMSLPSVVYHTESEKMARMMPLNSDRFAPSLIDKAQPWIWAVAVVVIIAAATYILMGR